VRLKEATLKHFVERPIFDDGRYCDASVHSAKGWIVYNADGDSVGLYEDPDKASVSCPLGADCRTRHFRGSLCATENISGRTFHRRH